MGPEKWVGTLAIEGVAGAMFVSTAALGPARQAEEKPWLSSVTEAVMLPPPVAASIPRSFQSGRQALTLDRLAGIEDLHVRSTTSGDMARFSYRVVDAQKANILNDKRMNPILIVKKSGSKLDVPETEKVGKRRQTSRPQDGREYWMAFRNHARIIQLGDHVDIVIGMFRANELAVESSGPIARVQ